MTIRFTVSPSPNIGGAKDGRYPNGDAPATSAVLPFTPIPISFLKNKGRKKVFAHYFTQFPPKINNLPSPTDYYDTQYLAHPGDGPYKNPASYVYGPWLRARPIDPGVTADDGGQWQNNLIRGEVDTAHSYGIDGFSWNILSLTGYHWDRGLVLLAYCEAQNNDFKMLLMPDMNAIYKADQVNPNTSQFYTDEEAKVGLADIIESLIVGYPDGIARAEDGRPLISPYFAESRNIAWWTTWLDEMESRGHNIAFMPTYQGWENDTTGWIGTGRLYGASDWGEADVKRNVDAWRTDAGICHSRGWKWMHPVRTQDHRPHNFGYYEAKNWGLFRETWDSAISNDADHVQIITWNDYGEHAHVAPSNRNGTSHLELVQYYINWFKTGVAPTITRDVMYWCHRRHHTDAVYTQDQIRTASGQAGYPNGDFENLQLRANAGTEEPTRNYIEMLVLLTAGADLEIWLNGSKLGATETVGAGLQSITRDLPFNTAGTANFKIIRNATTILQSNSHEAIITNPEWQDFHYASGRAAS